MRRQHFLKAEWIGPGYWNSKPKPSVKAGIYKTMENSWLLIVRQRNLKMKFSIKGVCRKPCRPTILNGAMLAQIAFPLKELKFGILLILMLFCLLAETLLGLPQQTFQLDQNDYEFCNDSYE